MTPDEGRDSSKLDNSNSTDDDRSRADDVPKEFLISYAVIHFSFFLFCLFMVIYLSIRLKKRAWDNPAKRFANIFNVCFALLAICIPVMKFIGVFSDIIERIALFTFFLLSLANFLYFIAMYVVLSLQIVTPFLSEGLKLYAHKTHCVKFTEIASHVLFLLLAICYSVFHVHYYKLAFPNYAIYIIMGVILIVFILASSFLFFAFIFLIRFFKYHNNKKKGLKYMIIKLFFLLIIFITFVITFVLLHFYQTLNFLLLVILQWVLYFILSILVVSLNHPLDIWCCKCHLRRSPPRSVPMIPVNNTEFEGQQTNPISVWDHRNVPSYTVTNLPYDMSDCRSDYEQYA